MSWPALSWSKTPQEIAQVLEDYFEGYQNADVTLIKKAFHPATKLLSVENGKLDNTEMNDWLKNLEDRQARGDVRKGTMTLKSIDIKDYAAAVKLKIAFEKFIFTDYLSLLLIEGEWIIVGKIYVVTEL